MPAPYRDYREYWMDEDPNEVLMRQYGPKAMPPPPPPVPRGTGPALANIRQTAPPPDPRPMQPPLGIPFPDPQPPFPDRQPQNIYAENPLDKRFEDIAARRAEHLSARPVAGDRQYERHWGEKAALIGANALAGLVNASGRTRVQPISPDMISSRPKYESAMAQWEASGNGMNAELAGVQHERERRLKEENAVRQKEVSASQIRMNDAHANYYNRPRRPEAAARPFSVTGGFVDAQGNFHKTTPAATPRPPGTPESVLMDPNSTPEQRATAERLRGENFAARAKKPGGGPKRDPGVGTPVQFRTVESQKALRLQRAEEQFRKAIVDAPDESAKQTAAAELERQKRQIQSDFEDGVISLGGSITPKATPAPAPAAAPTVAPAPAARIPKYNRLTRRLE